MSTVGTSSSVSVLAPFLSFCGATSRGRQSATAAAMIEHARAGQCRANRGVHLVGGFHRHDLEARLACRRRVPAVTSVTVAPRRSAAAASSLPILPLDRLPM